MPPFPVPFMQGAAGEYEREPVADDDQGIGGADMLDPLQGFLESLGAARAMEVDAMEAQRVEIERQRSAIKKDIKNKKARDNRLINRAAKDLTADQMMQVAAIKAAAAAKAKARAAAKPKSKAKAKAAA